MCDRGSRRQCADHYRRHSPLLEAVKNTPLKRLLGDKFGANFSGTGPYAEVVQASTGFVDAIKNASLRGIAGAASPVIGLRGVARMMLNSDGRRGLIELAKLPPGSKQANDLAAYLASVAAVRTDSGGDPLEIEVTGGQPGAAPTQEEMEALRAKAQMEP